LTYDENAKIFNYYMPFGNVMSRCKIWALAFILAGMIIVLHQFFLYGKVWEWNDSLHHEWFVALSIAFGLGILAGEKLKEGMED